MASHGAQFSRFITSSSTTSRMMTKMKYQPSRNTSRIFGISSRGIPIIELRPALKSICMNSAKK